MKWPGTTQSKCYIYQTIKYRRHYVTKIEFCFIYYIYSYRINVNSRADFGLRRIRYRIHSKGSFQNITRYKCYLNIRHDQICVNQVLIQNRIGNHCCKILRCGLMCAGWLHPQKLLVCKLPHHPLKVWQEPNYRAHNVAVFQDWKETKVNLVECMNTDLNYRKSVCGAISLHQSRIN